MLRCPLQSINKNPGKLPMQEPRGEAAKDMPEIQPNTAEAPACANNSVLLTTLRALPKDPLGFSHLGMDGVWRNFGHDRNVISYRALSPEEIFEVPGIFPGWVRERIEKGLEGVDGRDVTDIEQLLHPREELLPKFEDDGGL
ncbi:uncharacterized protein BO95DRAFT_442109 [Aspergillus brunneoviolaceus CBS 621.78]|uniref:Uncharacterized protein n=1 Tax=Aspergillus brunneoviolaceus CBS 621.78 TaxID=1450534 RepID=A0ACD1GBI8_9EURO|nr:hypothetical protein BO95DRAFT_442109 [Aspergillus brunneoviolaceus CBS 621.78]RAH46595.1 hypothetical protein BO95DRAFT_442109 [Aspergillus brunneoviolaceus CBS 621.78]